MSWSLVVYLEKGVEKESVVPSCWVQENYVYWSNALNAERDYWTQKKPLSNWSKYQHVKTKLSSDDYDTCDKYTFTSDEGEISASEKNVGYSSKKDKLVLPKSPLMPKPPNVDKRHVGPYTDFEMRSPGVSPRIIRVNATSDRRRSPRLNKSSFASSPVEQNPTVKRALALALPDSVPSSSQSTSQPVAASNKEKYPLPDHEFQRKVFLQFAEHSRLLREIRQKLGNVKGATNDNLTEFEFDKCMEMDDVINLNEKVKTDKSFKSQFSKYLSKQCGSNLHESTKNILVTISHYGIWSQFTYFGTSDKSKKGFKTMELFEIFKACILSAHPSENAGTIKERLQSFFRFAPDREGGGGRPKRKSSGNSKNSAGGSKRNRLDDSV